MSYWTIVISTLFYVNQWMCSRSTHVRYVTQLAKSHHLYISGFGIETKSKKPTRGNHIKWRNMWKWWGRHLWTITTISLIMTELPSLLSINPTLWWVLRVRKYWALMKSFLSLASCHSINADTWSAPSIHSHLPLAAAAAAAAAALWSLSVALSTSQARSTTWGLARYAHVPLLFELGKWHMSKI